MWSQHFDQFRVFRITFHREAEYVYFYCSSRVITRDDLCPCHLTVLGFYKNVNFAKDLSTFII